MTDACLYYYRRRGDSITGSGFDPHSLDAVDALGERAAFYREHGEERLAVLTDATTCHRLCAHAVLARAAFAGRWGEEEAGAVSERAASGTVWFYLENPRGSGAWESSRR